MKHSIRGLLRATFCLLLLLAALFVQPASAQTFVHPGAISTQADFDRMKAEVASGQWPWYDSYQTLSNDWLCSLGHVWNHIPIIYRADPVYGSNYSYAQTDAICIYYCALKYRITGDTRYADKAIEGMDVWSSTLTREPLGSNGMLAVGLCGYEFAVAGETLRGYPGWSQTSIDNYKKMLGLFAPVSLNYLNTSGPHPRSNWLTDNMACLIACAVFCDNQDWFNAAVNYYKYGSPTVGYTGNGHLDLWAWFLHPEGIVQMEESGRDQAHCDDALSTMTTFCQIAANQGVDLFGYDNNRFLRGAEYFAKYNLGNNVPFTAYFNGVGWPGGYYESVISPGARGSVYFIWEMINNHFIQKGIYAPYTAAYAAMLRPSGSGEYWNSPDSFGYDTLTHYQTPPATDYPPSGLMVNFSSRNATLSWFGSLRATSYNVKRSTVSGGPYTTIATTNSTTLNYVDTQVPRGATYYYVVSAVTPSGETANTPEAIAGCVTRYNFNGDASDTFGAFNGTLACSGSSGLPGFTTGLNGGQALLLNGTDQYVQLPPSSLTHEDFTIAAWVKWSGGGAYQMVFDTADPNVNRRMFLTVSDGSRMRFYITDDWHSYDATLYGPTPAVNTWTHVAVTIKQDAATLYENGVPTDTEWVGTCPLFGQTFTYIGKSMYSSDAYFKGAIQDFRVYNTALAGTEIFNLWGQGTNHPPQFASDPMILPEAWDSVPYTGHSVIQKATDVDGGALTFSKVGGAAWVKVGANGELSGTPGTGDVGVNVVNIRVTDPLGATDDATCYITVNNVNQPPAWNFSTLTKPSINQNEPYSDAGVTLAGDVTDPDTYLGDTVTFSKVSGPAWLTVASSGTLSGTPGAGDTGLNTFTVRATDASGATADVTLNITVVPYSLRSQYQFEGNLADNVGSFNGTTVGYPTYAPGRIGQAIAFNGATDCVKLPAGVATYHEITIAAWVYWNGGTAWQRIFDFGNDTSHYINLTPYSGSAMRFAINNGGGDQTITTTTMPTGRWTHVALTLSGSTATLYVNGTAAGSNTAITVSPTDFAPTNNLIGDSQFSADPFLNGKIDDFRIYNYALSASDISSLVGSVAPLAPTGLTATGGNGSLQVTLSWSAAAGATSYNVKRATSPNGTYSTIYTGSATSFIDTTGTPGATYYYIVTAVDAGGESTASSSVAQFVNSSTPRVYLRMDELSGTTASDSSGNGWNGTLVGGTSWAAGKINNAVSLSGSSNYVSLPSGVVTSMTNCTISAWVKINSLSTWARIFDIGTGTTNYMFLAPSSGASKARFAIRTPSIGEQQINSTVVSPTGTWAHFAVTLSGSVGTLYLNGTSVGTNTAMTLNPTSLGTTTLNYIGKSQFSDPYLNGLVDEFQIYPRALSSTEIATLVASIAAPTGVTITGGTAQATVSWNPVANATGYNLKRSGTSGGPYTVVQANVSGTTATDSNLLNSANYYYVVTALNGVAESVNSSEVTTTTAAGAPPVPAGLQATGTSSLVSLTWTPSNGATSYNILRSLTSGTGYVLTGTSTTASYSDSTVSNGTTYYYVVNAVGPNGQSANSSEASVLPMGIPGLVTGLTATGTWGAVILSWNPTPMAYYNIQRTQTSGSNYLAVATVSGTTGFVDTGLTNGVTYWYIISAQNALGQGPFSAEVRVSPVASPAAPTANASGGNGQVGILWNGVSGATSYAVKRSGTSGGPYTVVYSGTATSFFDQSVSNATTYYYIVTASNAGGEGSASTELVATPASTPLINYLRFDELSGTTAYDSTGNGWNGALIGGTTWATGKINNAVSFSGSSNYMTLPNGVTTGAKDYTISAWVKLNSAVNWARLFDFGTGTANYLMLCPRAGNGGNYLRLEAVTGGVVQQINTTYTFPTGTWVHVAATLSGSTGTLYVNGTSAGTNAAMTLNPSSMGISTRNYIGKSQWSSDPYLNGLVDEFKIYGRALSASEVSALANPLAAPASLTATAGNSQITCNWSAVSGAASYNLKRGYVSGGPYTTVATVSGTTYTDTTTVPESPYYYVVTSGSGLVESTNSVQASATPTMAIPVVTSATSASGTNGSAFSYQITASNVVNSFGATGLPSGLNLDSGSGIISGTASVSGTYSIGISATNDAGTGNATLALTLRPPAPVISSGLTKTGTSGSSFSYTITASNSPTSFAATGLPTGLSVNTTNGAISGTPSVSGSFPVTISATNSGGTGNATLQILLFSGSFGAPTGLSATDGNGAVTLAWNPVVGASTYKVKRTLTSGSNYTTVATGLSSPSYSDSGLTNRTPYYYVVSAVTSGGTESANSSEVGAIPAPPLTWVGGGADAYWQTPGNWSSQPVAGNPLSFDGNLRLSNTNNYPLNTQFGAITFNSAAGAFALSGNDLNLAGDIVNNSGTTQTINLNLALVGANRTINAASANITLAGVISQSGGTYGLIKSGTGALTLYGANTFRGGIVLNQGFLNVENNSALGTGTLSLAGGTLRNSTNNGGTRVLYNSMAVSAGTTSFVRGVAADFVLNGNISGSGTLDVCGSYNGSGMRLSGNNSGFTGTVNISGPNLRLDSPYSGSANAAWIVGVSGTGGLQLNSWDSGNIFQLGSLSGNGCIEGHYVNSSSQVQTLSVGALGTDTTFSGTIIDNAVNNPAFGNGDGAANNVLALTKVGAGTLTLSGSNPYSGPTTVNAGTLKLNGILSGTSAVTVNSGGTLAGTGTSSGPVTVASGATIAPGDSGAGTLTINSALSLNDGSILNVQLSGTGSSDLIILGGGFSTTGTTTLNVAALSGFGEGTYPVITGTAAISAANFALGTVPAGYACTLSASNGVLSVTSILLPQAPTGLSATPGDTIVNLSWNTTPTATSYNVKRSTTSGSGYVTIASAASTSFSDTGLTNGATYYYVVSAVNTGGEGPNSSEVSAMPVPPAPVISSAASATGTTGSAFSYGITASNSPTSYAASGLPSGLSVNTSTGSISGVPTVTGSFNVTLSATNLGGTGTATLALTVFPPAPVITSAATASGTTGSTFSYNIVGTNNPTSYAATGLPSGLTLNTSTGLINGTPTVTGTFTVAISASNAGGTGSATLTVTVVPPAPVITSGLTSTGTTGVAFSYQITASNSPTNFAATGLPAGLSVNTSTGQVSGTPTTTGTTNVTISATNAGGTGTATLTITVVPPAPVITSGLTSTGTAGVAFSYQITATNSPTNYAATGLPAGLSVDTSTGLISGTPSATGSTSVAISASNAGGTGSATWVVTILPAAPGKLSGSGSNNAALLSWNTSSGATSYNVKRSTTSGSGYAVIASGTGTTYTDSSVSNGTTYYYVVSTVNSYGEGPNSSEIRITPDSKSLIAYHRFDEGTGTVASDSTGYGWNGTMVNGAGWGAGEINSAVSLTGSSSQYVSFPTGVVKGVTNCTFVAWVNPSTVSNWMRIFDFGTGTNANMFLTAQAADTGKVRFAITTSGGAGEQRINGPSALPAGIWTHVAVTISGSTGTLYVSGTVAGTNTSMTLNPASLGNTAQNYIGKSQYSDPYLNGSVDQFQIYSRALSASEIAVLANPPTAPGGVIATGSNASAIVSWNTVSGATAYNVSRSVTSGSGYTTLATAVSGTSYLDTSLTNGSTYYYVITALNGLAESSSSIEASASPVAPPAAPTGLNATAGDTSVALSWTAASGATGYNLKRSLSSDGSFVLVGSGTSTSYTDSGLTNGTTYYYVVSATNPGGESANSTEASAIPVPPAPVITSATSASATAGSPFSYTIAATNSPTSYNATGLPTGMSVNSTTGAITGSPSVTGTFNCTISATNLGGTGTASLVITVLPPAPVITSAATASGTSGVAFAYSITASNSPTSYAASGLPAGLSVNTSTGLISGTPSATGTTNVTISASNAGGTGSATLTITVVPPAPVITSGLSASGTTGVAFSYSIVGTNSPSSYAASGLPAGLSVNTSTGLISGTPSATGTTNVTISASNAGGTGSATLTINVVPPAPVITSGLNASGTTGVAFSYSIAATNSPTSYAASGLPAGLSVNTATGLISGTPSATGTTSVTISASNAGGTGSATLTITVVPPAPVITSGAVATGTYGSAFSYTIAASNSPTSFGATGLPAGLNVNTSTGLISGTPVVTGTYSATISANNAGGTGSGPLTITVGSLVNNTWTGGGSNALWQTSANWTSLPGASSPLVFAGSLQLSNTNDFAAGTQFASLTFNSGAGAFTLNGNSFALSGAIAQNSANLQTINNAINLANTGASITHTIGSGGLTLNGSLSNSSNIRTVTITGSGILTLNGTTTWNFGGADYSSPYLNGGNLTIGNGGVLTVNGAANNFSGYFNVAGTSTLSVLSGGALTVNGRTASVSTTNLGASSGDNVVYNISGTATYGDGNNLQIGGNAGGHSTMNINSGGILSLVNASRTMAIGTNGTINLNSGGTLASARSWVAGSGTLALSGGTFKAMANQSLAIANSLTTTSTTSTIDANSYVVSIGNAISGTGGLIIASGSGAGSVTLSGTSTFSGPTRVSSGTLNLLGILSGSSSVKVDAGATLAGTGTAAGTITVSSGGAIAPGNGGAGTLSVGSLTLNDGAVLNLELSGTGTSDKVAVAGAVSASGTTTINLTALSGFGSGTYPLISGTAALNSANFKAGTAPSGYGYTLSASSGVLSVTVLAVPGTPTGVTATAGDTTVNLTWTASSGATSYNVKRSLASGGSYSVIATGTSTSFTDTGLTDGTAYYYVVSASNSAGESANSIQASAVPTNNTSLPRFSLSGDIGTTGATGTTSLVSGTYTMQGAGADISGTADAFQYMYQQVTGDCDVRVRVTSVQNTNAGAKAGVMIRNTLTASSQFADTVVTSDSGVISQWRTTTSGTVGSVQTTGPTAPYWVRLVRSGSNFISYSSADGATWATSGTTAIAMNSTVYVGLAVTSHLSGTLCTATMDNYSVVSLPSPWSSSDVGTVGSAGSATYSGTTYTIAGSGVDISGTADAFRYAYQTSTGDCDITARVSDISVTNGSAKAAVMVRESLNANSINAMVVVTPSAGISFQWRSTTGGSTSTTAGPSLTAPYWIRLVRSGSAFTGYYSADGTTWTAINSTTITMASSANMGLGVTSHSDGVLCTATLDNVTANP